MMLDEKNYLQRSRAYEYYHFLEKLKWAKKIDSESRIGIQLRSQLAQDKVPDFLTSVSAKVDAKKEIDDIENKLKSADYDAVRDELKRLSDEKKKISDNWYALWNGPNSLLALARELSLLSFYEILYRSWSNITHGNGALKRVLGSVGQGKVAMVPLRSPAGLPEIALQACNLINALSLFVIEKMAPQMRQEFSNFWTMQLRREYGFIQQLIDEKKLQANF